MDESLFAVWTSLRCGAGNGTFVRLLEEFDSFYAIYNADESELKQAGADSRTDALCNKDLSDAYQVLNFCQNNNVGIVTYEDRQYPRSLKALKDPPCVLYFKGTFPDFSRRLCISTVGKRDMTEYGMISAYKIAYELAAAGVLVVSGGAAGIDGTSAVGAISANGMTVAVLGCGIDVVYPKQHTKLFESICRHGCIITEYPPSTPPKGYNFPVRNRIISGLAQGVIVIEADTNSGAMITARHAIMQGKDIFAVPGNIGNYYSTGTNQLIHDGATIALSARNVLDSYGYVYRREINYAALAFAEKHSDLPNGKLGQYGVIPAEPDYTAALDNIDMQTAGEGLVASDIPYIEDDTGKKETAAKRRNTDKRSASEPADTNPCRPERTGDKSAELVAALPEKQRKVFEEIPIDKSVSADELSGTGYTMGEIMAALTMLEIKGLIHSLPGGLYGKN